MQADTGQFEKAFDLEPQTSVGHALSAQENMHRGVASEGQNAVSRITRSKTWKRRRPN